MVKEAQAEENTGFRGFSLFNDGASADNESPQFDFLDKLKVEILESLQLEAKYYILVVKSTSAQSKNSRKKLRINIERAVKPSLGITVEVGREHFETEIYDLPYWMHRFVHNMITGASQADIGVLVISARIGEFESGFEGGGKTREHVQLAKTLGVSKLVVVVNKMDYPTVNWSRQRYDEIVSKKEELRAVEAQLAKFTKIIVLEQKNSKESKPIVKDLEIKCNSQSMSQEELMSISQVKDDRRIYSEKEMPRTGCTHSLYVIVFMPCKLQYIIHHY
ncbi:translation elongation factor EF1A/initiation factor IF2gamma family protein [Artemisia annua]|uniref:Translation elongation factor EF1A/initiation factor IF2gamma family protein n=1 Tax=Artemisia annua TaxID=35608 RepID=A0A2U1PDA9_ARTAN|nr:translation elongation factor EF1A/initiation factor IF2gamma family protein [Artemisia annua]